MKKLLIALFLVALMASPALALFVNGGFEDGTFNGWTLTYGNVLTTNTNDPSWTGYIPTANRSFGSPIPTNSIVDSSATYPGVTNFDINPYVGTYMAKINDLGGDWDATRLSQSDTITAADLTETVYVDWGAVLADPQHGPGEQPFFSIQVLRNGVVVNSFSADATAAATPGSGWIVSGKDQYNDNVYYKAGQYSYALSGFNVGDTITVDMFVTDCSPGAHGGFAFLDGIGTVQPPNPTVPEPSTMLLLGAGLAGLGLMRRRSKK